MTTSVNLGISTDAIAREIYAASALRSLLSDGAAEQPLPVLSRDSRPALNILIRDSYCRVALMLAGHVASLDEAGLAALGSTSEPQAVDGDTVIDLTLYTPRSWRHENAPALCAAVVHAMAMTALDIAFTGVDHAAATRYETLAVQAVQSVATLLCGTTPPPVLARHLL